MRILLSGLLVIISFNVSAQTFPKSSMVDADSVSINGFKYGDGIEKCKQIFGEPESFKTYDQSDGLGPEGQDIIYYVDYKSIHFTFYEYQKEIFLEGIDIKNGDYRLKIGNYYFGKGTSLKSLAALFPKSYKEYQNESQEGYGDGLMHFIVDLKIKTPHYTKYGLIHFYLKDDQVTKIGIMFDLNS